MIKRRILPYIVKDLDRHKMVFLSGPRQSGKTTLSTAIPFKEAEKKYYNWDIDTHRKLLKESKLDEASTFWIFDEIHKNKKWRNWLKGLYDLHRHSHKIIVTGSARLDFYSRGGDSLQGRYFNYHLHPITLSEFLGLKDLDYRTVITESKLSYNHERSQEKLLKLLDFSGFPEPLLSNSKEFSGRWRLAYRRLLVREDVRTLEQTQELDQMELLYERLPDLISNNLSINNLAKDLEISHQTVSKWLKIFERLYACFYVLPWGEHKIKAVKKEKKLYLWDWASITDPGARLENIVAAHLLRLVHWFEDIYGEIIELRYFRDSEGHEVDFILLKDKKPWIAIEVKSSEQTLSKGLKYFLERVAVPYAYQIHLKSNLDTRLPNINKTKIRSMPVAKFLCLLP